MLRRIWVIGCLCLLASPAAWAGQENALGAEGDQLLARLEAVTPDEPAEVTPEITGMIWRAGETKRLDAAVLLIRALAFNHSTSGSNELRSLVGMLPAAESLTYHYKDSVLPLLMYAGITTQEEWLRQRIALVLRECYKPRQVTEMRAVFSLETSTSPSARRLKEYLDAPALDLELFNPNRKTLDALEKWIKELQKP